MLRILFLTLALFVAGCSSPATPPAAPVAADVPAPPAGDPVEGLRVATRVGCNGCHGADAAGRSFSEDKDGNLIVAPNLSMRRHLYTDEGLAALLHEGRTHDGHVPFGMPIQSFQHLSHREVRDIVAWMRALPEVPNGAQEASTWSPALAAAITDGSHPWLGDMQPTPGNQPVAEPPTEPLALGRHLALTTCSECHGWDLNGFGDPGAAPHLVVAKAYTDEQFARLMRTGEVATGGPSATGMMTKVSASRFSVMTDAEVQALKDYLDSR